MVCYSYEVLRLLQSEKLCLLLLHYTSIKVNNKINSTNLQLSDSSQEAVIPGEDKTGSELPRDKLCLLEVVLERTPLILEVILELFQNLEDELDLDESLVRFTLEDLFRSEMLGCLEEGRLLENHVISV